MSNLKTVKEVLRKGCFCHSNEVKFMFECMPTSVSQHTLKSCEDNSSCYHNQEPQIKAALERFVSFMEKQATFKIEDRVELARTPNINSIDSPGWLGCEHFLVEGSKGTIREISYYGNEFGYSVSFDDESWKDDKGRLHPKNDKKCTVEGCTFPKHNGHTFFFSESSLRRAGVKPCEFLSKLWSDFYKIGD